MTYLRLHSQVVKATLEPLLLLALTFTWGTGVLGPPSSLCRSL